MFPGKVWEGQVPDARLTEIMFPVTRQGTSVQLTQRPNLIYLHGPACKTTRPSQRYVRVQPKRRIPCDATSKQREKRLVGTPLTSQTDILM